MGPEGVPPSLVTVKVLSELTCPITVEANAPLTGSMLSEASVAGPRTVRRPAAALQLLLLDLSLNLPPAQARRKYSDAFTLAGTFKLAEPDDLFLGFSFGTARVPRTTPPLPPDEVLLVSE